MADIILGLVGPIIEIGKCVASPVKRQFTYLCCFDSNIQSLRDKARNLENKKKELLMEIDAPENNGLSIIPEVQTWIENADRKIEGAGEISNFKIGCWDIKSRYQLSRKAVKITEEMKQLVEDLTKFDRKCRRPSPAAHVSIPQGETREFQSRKEIEDGIVEVLRANEIRIVGISGMGGVGKTTMAKRIMNRVRDLNIFKETPMAVVGQEVDMLKIQEGIAESLDLKLEKKTLAVRANELRTRLTGTNTKRILVVLDDVWGKLELNDLGIPCENEWCTILLTSRNSEVLTIMGANKLCAMEILSKEEAWSLFRERVGNCVDDDENLHSVAERVAKECKGLPIALVAVAGALRNQTDKGIWGRALNQLRRSSPEYIQGVIEVVYKPLKLSYTSLETRDAKTLFLLCSIFPEDDNISLEDLALYCLGLRMFCNSNFSYTSEGTLEIVRQMVFTIANMLKNRFLLLEGRDEDHVRMHDVVRDVAIYIASHEAKEGEVDVKFNLRPSREFTFEWVSVFSKKSNLLRMHAREKGFEIKDSSLFKEIEELNVLSFKKIPPKSLPMATKLLKNLRTLRLESCELESLSVVGELLSLEILCCYNCDIVELPVEIGKLIHLKLLHFSHCYSLRRIPPGVISKLEELEEFKMLDSFKGWESAAAVQGQERRNASLNEFEKLLKLTCLEIQIKDSNLAAEEICFPPNIVNYYIGIDDGFWVRGRWPPEIRGMYMKLWREIKLGSCVVRFLRSSNHLELWGDVPFCLDLPQAHSMKSLELFGNRSTDKRLVNSTTSIDDQSKLDVFPILEYLRLSHLPNLEEIFDGEVLDSSNSFNNLGELIIDDMPALKHLCKRPDRSPVSLDNLELIKIRGCSNLVNLFLFTMDGQNDNASIDDLLCIQEVHYPKLEYLKLDQLDKLEVIWNTQIPVGSNSFKNLRKLELSRLTVMTHLWKSPSRNISLNNLSEVRVDNCHKLRSLFLSTMSMDFVLQLQMLHIESCEMMEQIMLLNEENENGTNQFRTVEFSKLSNLTLHSLQSLTTFSKRIESIEFPKLIKMSIKSCPKLTSLLPSTENNQYSAEDHDNNTFHLFCSEKVSFGSLKEFCIEMNADKSNMWCRQISSDFFNQLEKLEIVGCNGIKSLFSTSVAEKLVNLRKLEIKNCYEMVKVIEDNEEEMLYGKSLALFPNLKELKFESLNKLESFCNWRCNFQLSSLEIVHIRNCSSLEFFNMGFVSTPNLKSVSFGRNDVILGDLNSEIQSRFKAKHQPSSTKKESTSTEQSTAEANQEESEIEEKDNN